ncbi:hypothetical protein ACL58G_21350 [Massilia sp. GER05]|uniref:hypothetical protein n=1 Tax=unclassified Massilia TaxID=2609279 RepID=UPI0039A6BF16
MPQKTHQLVVTYVKGQTTATWSLDGVPHHDGDALKVQSGDKITFQFDGPDDIAECVLISGKMETKCHGGSPFTEGNRINLKANSTVVVGQQHGLWGFTVSFSTSNSDGTSSFYFLPDPEVDVGTMPPMCD